MASQVFKAVKRGLFKCVDRVDGGFARILEVTLASSGGLHGTDVVFHNPNIWNKPWLMVVGA